MPLNRILSYLNYVIGLAAVLFLAMGYWYLYRPQAQTSGSERAGVAAEVRIERDSLGVPHIRAASLDDLFFAQGYVHAQDRLFQLDLTRRQAAGELAEVFGAGALANDVDARRMRIRRIAEMHAASLSPASRAVIMTYARGINHFIETHRGRLPLEFALVGYDPAPWTVTDTMLAAMNMARSLSESWQFDLSKQTMLNGSNKDMVDYLFPAGAGVESQVGSNAWVVGGQFTQTGKPMLANDPHLPLSLPGIWYQNDLRAPGFHAAGVSIPGIPAIVIGHNDNIAWGMTNLQFDVQDLYVERVDMNAGLVLVQGAPQPISRATESIRVRGQGIVTLATTATSHGPITTDNAAVNRTPYQLAVRWTVAQPGGLSFPLLALNQAANWDQFRAALRNWAAPPQNFVYADRAGNIGYQAAGHLPKRPNHSGDLPVDGGGEFEWDGLIPFDELPSVYNPPSGRIVSANQSTFPAGYAYKVNGNFAPPYRARQIDARLASKSKLTANDMIGIQRDLYSAFHHFLAGQLAAAARDRTGADRRIAEAVKLLTAWTGQMTGNSPAALITALAWPHLRQAIVERAAPGKAAGYDFPMLTAAAERLLRERPEGWFQSYDRLLLQALLDALTDGAKEQGADIADWRLGRHQTVTLTSPVLGQLSVLRRLSQWGLPISLGPDEMGGAPTTVSQHTRRGATAVAPSMRMVVDLDNLDASVWTLSTGQSGQVASRHYTDQWTAYRHGGSFPFHFNKVEAADVLRLTPR